MAVWDYLFGLPTWLYVLILTPLLIYLYGVWPFITSRFKFPGPRPTAFIGTVGEMFSKGIAESDSGNIKTYGDVTLTWGVRQPQLLVADPDMIKEILVKQFPNFVNRSRKQRYALSKVESEQLTVLHDDHWKFVRATLSPAFSSGRLREMLPLVHRCLYNLHDAIVERSKDQKSIDTQALFQGYTLDAISATAFGMDSCILKNPDDPFALLLKRLFSKKVSMLAFFNMIFPFTATIMGFFGISSLPKEWQETVAVISRDVKNNIEERKQQRTTRRDLLQLMIDARADDLDLCDTDVDKNALKNDVQKQRKGLTETEIMAQSFVFLLGGYATTAGTLTMMSYCLAMNPDCQEILIDEIDRIIRKDEPSYENVMGLPYLDMCLSETLRMYPAAQRISRVSKDDTVIKGHLISKDLSVEIPVTYLHYNPDYWPDPDTFNPERFTAQEKAKRHPYVYLPFGQGPRNCVGMRLAFLKAKMAMVSILQRYRFVRSPETEVPLNMSKFGIPEATNGVWLKLEPRTR